MNPFGAIGSSGTQIQWPRQRISEKSCEVTGIGIGGLLAS
jgi:hypothetical protein